MVKGNSQENQERTWLAQVKAEGKKTSQTPAKRATLKNPVDKIVGIQKLIHRINLLIILKILILKEKQPKYLFRKINFYLILLTQCNGFMVL